MNDSFDLMAVKLLVPAVIVVLSLLITWFITNKFSLVLDFSKVFVTEIIPPPPGVNLKINGIDGDSAIIAFSFDGSVSSESLTVTRKNIEEVKSSLEGFQFDTWERLTKVPESIFKFDVLLYSPMNSPNNGKKDSVFIITDHAGVERELKPGNIPLVLGRNFKFQDLENVLSKVSIKLSNPMGIYFAPYDVNGQFVGQSTGTIKIRPTLFIQMLILGGSLISVLALLATLKKLVLSGKDIEEMWNYFFNKS